MQITYGNRSASKRSFQETLKSALYLLKYSFTIMHEDQIPGEYREQLMGYLRMGAAVEASS